MQWGRARGVQHGGCNTGGWEDQVVHERGRLPCASPNPSSCCTWHLLHPNSYSLALSFLASFSYWSAISSILWRRYSKHYLLRPEWVTFPLACPVARVTVIIRLSRTSVPTAILKTQLKCVPLKPYPTHSHGCVRFHCWLLQNPFAGFTGNAQLPLSSLQAAATEFAVGFSCHLLAEQLGLVLFTIPGKPLYP